MEFAVSYLQNSHFQLFVQMEGVMFHTQEFARIFSGELGAEIMKQCNRLCSME